MEKPVCPSEPGKRPEDEDVINHAMAVAIVEIKKVLKDKICVKTSVSTWNGAEGTITIIVPGSQKEWNDYRDAVSQYRDDLVDYEAEQYHVSREVYIEARDKLNEYNRKKCEKAPDKDIEDFIANIIEVPDDDEIVVAS